MVLDQLSSNPMTPGNSDANFSKFEIGQCRLVAFFSRKMIPTETRFKTHNKELLAIIEVFKAWRHYVEGCQYEVFVLTYPNNLCQFKDTKSLSSRQVWRAKKPSWYHFRIDYRQENANSAAGGGSGG